MPRKQRPASRRAPQQIDLFEGGAPTTNGSMPVWAGLPTEIQIALTELMARLLLGHATKCRIDFDDGGGHDL